MSDVQANIILQTTGGDASAAEINKATQALGNVTSASGALQTKFQERFQHIGLQLFAGQALQSIGLSGETRQAVMLMNTAITGAEVAAGIASGGLTLLLTALVAVGAAVYEVIGKHKDLIATLDQTVQSQQANLKATNDSITTIQDYKKIVSDLTPAQKELLTAEQQLAAFQAGQLVDSEKKEIAAIQEQIAENTQHAHMLATVAQMYGVVKEAIAQVANEVKSLFPELKLLQSAWQAEVEGVKTLVGILHQHATASKLSGAETAALATKQQPLIDKMKELNASIEAGGTARKDDMQAAMTNEAATEQIIQKEMAAKKKADAESLKDYENTQKAMVTYLKSSVKDAVKEDKKEQEEMAKNWEKTTKTIAGDFQGFADEVVFQGESVTQALDQEWQKMEQQFMNYVIGMIVQWAALKAIMSIYPGGAAAFQGVAQAAYPGIASGAMGSISHNAIGSSQFADTPTLAVFGENGPEQATFTPLSGGTSAGGAGAGGGGGNNVITINVNGGMIDQNTLSKIGQYIVQTIRGQGQVSFA